MATAFRSITAPAAATHITAPRPANDNVTTWTADRRARLLLASIAANPPALVEHVMRYAMTAETHFAYAGYRAEALEAVRMEHGQRALDAYHTDPDASEAAFNAWCYAPTATQAIDALLGSC